MKEFEYKITTHPAEEFRHITYFCTAEGQCALSDVPEEQIQTLSSLLNARGKQGWELIQISFGKDGLIAFWKRPVKKARTISTKKT